MPAAHSIFRLAALKYPKGIGCDFAGRVLGKGKEVKDLQIGAEVMGLTFNPVRPASRRSRCQVAKFHATAWRHQHRNSQRDLSH